MRISDWSSDVCSSDLLSITKQSLGRVLHDLQERGLVESRVGASDRRQRLLRLSPAGEALERELYEQLRTGVADAYRRAGQSAVAGFWTVLEGRIPEAERGRITGLLQKEGRGHASGSRARHTGSSDNVDHQEFAVSKRREPQNKANTDH